MKKIKILSYTFFREIIRDKLFISLAVGAILLIFGSLILNEMIVGPKIKATRDLGITVLNLFSFFILIFLGSGMVSSDLHGKKLHYLFSKPVSRVEYLLSVAISIFMALVLCNLIIGLTIVLISSLSGYVFFKGIVIAIYFTLMEMMILLSFTVLFPIFTSPQLAMFLLAMIYMIGHSVNKAAIILSKSSNFILKNFIIILSIILPNFDILNKKQEILYNSPIPAGVYLNSFLYSISYSIIIFIIAIYVFKRRNV